MPVLLGDAVVRTGMPTGNDRVRCPDDVIDAADRIQKEQDLSSRGEALRHALREGGYID